MKIVCDNCATKYSIADEKVRGKVFKIRCKKCSHIIVVKGTEGGAVEVGSSGGDTAAEAAAEAQAEPGVPSGDGWHVVINGEQVGPLQPAEIRAKFHAGDIDAETYAWREGYGDWQRLASIDEFRDLAPAAPASDATKRSSSEDLFGGEPAAGGGGDLFGAPAGDLFAGGGPAAASGGGGLFAQPSVEPVSTPKRSPTPGFGAQSMSSTDAPGPAIDAKMTGQRNESSVLFSLNNLQALASGGGPANKASGGGGGGPVENRPGFANSQTEGSGLIDIRAMAAATLSSPSPSSGGGRDLPSFSSAPVFSPIAAPILMPSAPSGPPKWIWPVIALGVAAVVSIIVVGVMILNKTNGPVAAVAPAAATTPVAGTAPAAGTTPVAGTAPAAGTTPSPGTLVASNDKVDKAEKTDHTGGSRPAKGSGKTSAKSTAPVAGTKPVAGASEPAPTPAPTPAKKGKKGDDLDDLLNGASPEKKEKAAAREERPSSSEENLPDQLDKGAIVSGMGKVKPRVQGCYEQYKVPGLANVSVTIVKSGKVSNAAVSGAFAGTPTGDCVSKAVKGASFSQFKGSPQTINYPFSLR